MQQLGDGWAGQYPPQHAGYASPEHAGGGDGGGGASRSRTRQTSRRRRRRWGLSAALDSTCRVAGRLRIRRAGRVPGGRIDVGLYPPPFSASALYGSPQAGMAVDLSQVDPYAMIEANRKMKEENRKMKAAFCGGAAASKSGVDLLEASKSTDPYAVWRAEYAAEKATEWPMSPAPPASYGGPGWQSERLPRSGGGGVSRHKGWAPAPAARARSPHGWSRCRRCDWSPRGGCPVPARPTTAGAAAGPSAAPVPRRPRPWELAAEAAPPWTPATSVETAAPRPPQPGSIPPGDRTRAARRRGRTAGRHRGRRRGNGRAGGQNPDAARQPRRRRTSSAKRGSPDEAGGLHAADPRTLPPSRRRAPRTPSPGRGSDAGLASKCVRYCRASEAKPPDS